MCVCVCAYVVYTWAHVHKAAKNLSTNRYFYKRERQKETEREREKEAEREREIFVAYKLGLSHFPLKVIYIWWYSLMELHLSGKLNFIMQGLTWKSQRLMF